MEPTTLRLPADLAAELASEADEYGYGSRAEYIRRILRNRPAEDPVATDDGDETPLRERVDELEDRLAALEAERERQDGDGTGASERAPGEYAEGVWAVVESVAEDWDDTPERLAKRKEAAAAVLDHAHRRGEPVGRAEALEEFYDEYAVDGGYRGSWWRNTVRPALREAGEYAHGAGGYRVDGLAREV